MHLSKIFLVLAVTAYSFGCENDQYTNVDRVIAESKIRDLERKLADKRTDSDFEIDDLKHQVKLCEKISEARRETMLCLSRQLPPETPRLNCYLTEEN
jgi:hypothetical protein